MYAAEMYTSSTCNVDEDRGNALLYPKEQTIGCHKAILGKEIEGSTEKPHLIDFAVYFAV